MKRFSFFILLSGLIVTMLGHHAMAQDEALLAKERFQIRVRALGILPDDSADVNIGGDIDVSDAVTPELDITYFVTDHIAAELILATAQHELDHSGGSNLGEVFILPPTLTLQYHFTPDRTFSPYAGAGLNYSIFYGEDSGSGFTDLNVDNGVGVALQGGFDYWLNDNWGVNFDVKKLWLSVDASANTGSVTADVDIDPWIIGTGLAYRF